jgi:hypothetical protein
MCSYSGRTKLPPYGEHRSFTDTLFDPYFEKCPNCDGQGVVDTTENNHASGDKCSICPVCHFNQYLFTGTPEEFDAIRKQVITAYFPSKTGAKTDAPATTETAPQPPPPASEPAPLPPTSPAASSQAFFTRPADDSKEGIKKMAKEIAGALSKFIENERNFQITDHRSKYTYILRWWQKRGGTFYVKMDGVELRSISHPSITLAVLFIESPFVASVILDWGLKNLGVKERDIQKFKKSVPRPDHFAVVRDSAYLPIDDSLTQPMFDQLLGALAELDKAIHFDH